MCDFWKKISLLGIIGGVCFFACPVMSAEASEVIRDKQWTIKIRSNNRGSRPVSPAEQAQKRNVTPASYQAGADVAPAPESTEAGQTPAKEAPKAESPKPVGPVLPAVPAPAVGPSATPNPATHADPAARSEDLVPGIMPRTMTYEEAYAAVPFSRTEYEANPTYRHQAALELMFHTLRPTTMVQNFTPRAIRYPDSYQIPYSRSDTQHINIRNFGGGPNYSGYSPFGYPFGLKGNW